MNGEFKFWIKTTVLGGILVWMAVSMQGIKEEMAGFRKVVEQNQTNIHDHEQRIRALEKPR